MPTDARVVLAGDSEFGAVPLLQRLDAWRWSYGVRRKPDHLVRLTPDGPWRPFGSLVTEPGQCAWYAEARLTQLHAHPANLYAVWQPGEEDPWLLAANSPTLREVQRTCSRRMWLEEMFGDFKRPGQNVTRVGE